MNTSNRPVTSPSSCSRSSWTGPRPRLHASARSPGWQLGAAIAEHLADDDPPEAREIHLHLTVQAGTTVHVTINGDELTVASDNEAGRGILDEKPSSDQVLEQAIRRLEKANISPHIRDAVSGLRSMGYSLVPAETRIPGKRPENYLRIMDPEYTAHGIGYLTPGNFSFTRGPHRDLLARQPGARVHSSEVAFSHVESAKVGLAAARLLKV